MGASHICEYSRSKKLDGPSAEPRNSFPCQRQGTRDGTFLYLQIVSIIDIF